jgi:hypothetical protein
VRQNGPGVMFALAGSGPSLFMLNSNRSAVLQSNNINITNPTWTTIAGSGFAKIIGSGNQLFAVGNPVF